MRPWLEDEGLPLLVAEEEAMARACTPNEPFTHTQRRAAAAVMQRLHVFVSDLVARARAWSEEGDAEHDSGKGEAEGAFFRRLVQTQLWHSYCDALVEAEAEVKVDAGGDSEQGLALGQGGSGSARHLATAQARVLEQQAAAPKLAAAFDGWSPRRRRPRRESPLWAGLESREGDTEAKAEE